MRPWHRHDSIRHFVTKSTLLLVILMLALIPTTPVLADGSDSGHGSATGHGSSPGGAATVSPKETVHASYLDLTANISDLRNRVSQWQKGDDGSLGVAQEKLERIEVVLGHVSWPKNMAGAITKTKAAVEPMAKALKNKDMVAAETVGKTFGDASHDVIHAFYGDWLPGLKGGKFTSMVPHANYLDITANIADLKSRVAQWEKGDADSLGVAQEKADRIEVLVHHMSSSKALVKPVQAIDKALKPVNAALKAKDITAAQAALTPLSDASHDLTHDFYAWLETTAGVKDPACTQAAYLDLTLNISDLRARITAWEKGDEASLGVAQEKLERIEALLGHTVWPKTITPAIYKTGATLEPLAKALSTKDAVTAQTLAKTLGEASHDVTHAFYGVWLVSDAASGTHDTAMKSETVAQADDHGSEAVALDASSKALVLGGFGSLNLLVIVAAAVLKRTLVKEARAKAAHQASATTKGNLP